jgi:hypothetical protein
MMAFFYDLIEFLREFSSVPVEYRAIGPSPRRVHRAAVRPDPYARTLLSPRPARRSVAAPPVAARIDLVGTPAEAPRAIEIIEGPAALPEPAPVPPAESKRRATPKAAPEKAKPMRVPPFVSKM